MDYYVIIIYAFIIGKVHSENLLSELLLRFLWVPIWYVPTNKEYQYYI